MNDFTKDDLWQKSMRDRFLVPGFYKNYAMEGRYVLMDKGRMATIIQRRFAADTVIQGKYGEAVFVEEKIVRWPERGVPYTAFSLETHSCTNPGRESDGWMVYGEADYLMYCFENQRGFLDCHLMDFQALKEWFKPLEKTFPTFKMKHTINKSAGRVVPIDKVKAAVPSWMFKNVGEIIDPLHHPTDHILPQQVDPPNLFQR